MAASMRTATGREEVSMARERKVEVTKRGAGVGSVAPASQIHCLWPLFI